MNPTVPVGRSSERAARRIKDEGGRMQRMGTICCIGTRANSLDELAIERL